MKALFIGGSGYLGRNLMPRMKNYDEISYLSRTKLDGEKYSRFSWIEGDVAKIDDFTEIVKNFDEILYMAGTDSNDDRELFDVNVKGIKGVATAIKKLDKTQRLIYFSSINVHYGQNEYLRTKRTGEDNAALAKNHLNVRLSFVFGGEDDRFVATIKTLLGKGVNSFPEQGAMCPLHIDDLAKTLSMSSGIVGAIDANSRDRISFVQCMNIVARRERLSTVSPKTGFFSRNLGEKISDAGKVDPIMMDRLTLNYFRETSSVIRFISEEIKFEDYVNAGYKP